MTAALHLFLREELAFWDVTVKCWDCFFVSVTQDFFLEVSDDSFMLLDIEYCLDVTSGKIYLLLEKYTYFFG